MTIFMFANGLMLAVSIWLANRARRQLRRVETLFSTEVQRMLRGTAEPRALEPYRTPAEVEAVVVPEAAPPPKAFLWKAIYYNARWNCPKCVCYVNWKTTPHPKICECSDYPNAHYHYKCGTCAFTCVMRTADDVSQP